MRRRRSLFSGGANHVEITPIDAKIVAGLFKNGLLLRAQTKDLDVIEAVAGPGDWFIHRVDGNLRAGVEIDLDFMGPRVSGPSGPGEIGDGPGEDVEIVGEGGREEREGEMDVGSCELKGGVGGKDLERGLRESGQLFGIAAHNAIRFAIDAHQAAKGLHRTGPVASGLIGEVVGGRPDAEVRIVCDKRNGGRAEVGGREERTHGEEDASPLTGDVARDDFHRVEGDTVGGYHVGVYRDEEILMRRAMWTALAGCLMFGGVGAWPVQAQVKMTKEQMTFYTSDWKGERFADGRPKVADDLLKRALDVSIEDVWDYLREHGYRNAFEGGWQALHIEKPFAGRALTAQYMPIRADMAKAIAAEGKAEGRVSGNNSWPINELQIGDVYVADGFGKVIEGTLIGSNLGNGIAAHTHTGFVFDGGIRDQEENRAIPNFNGFYRGYDPSAWAQMELTAINAPVRIGRAVVLPGDLVLAKTDGVLFIPAILAEAAVSSAEFTNLKDAFNFELNRRGKNGAEFEGGWTQAKYSAMAKWVDAHPEMLKMSRNEFNALLAGEKK